MTSAVSVWILWKLQDWYSLYQGKLLIVSKSVSIKKQTNKQIKEHNTTHNDYLYSQKLYWFNKNNNNFNPIGLQLKYWYQSSQQFTMWNIK